MGPHIAVRSAAPADIPAIAALHLASWQSAYHGIVPEAFLRGVTLESRVARWATAFAEAGSRGIETIVATDDGKVVGVCSFGAWRESTRRSVGEVYALHVQPERRGQGLGSLLLGRTAHRLLERGFSEAVLWVLRANRNARGFYEALGWSATGDSRVESRDGHVIPEVRYATRLKAAD